MRPHVTQQEIDRLRRMAADVRLQIEAEDAGHLDPDQQMAYCDGLLRGDELEAARDHVEGCDGCRADIAELSAFRDSLRKPHWIRYAIAASVAAIALLGVLVFRQQPVRHHPPIAHRATPAPVAVTTRPAAPSYGRAEWDRLIVDVSATRRLAMPAVLASLQPPRSHFRSATQDDDARLEPDGIVVESARPRFSWRGEPDARYVVVLALEGDKVVESEPLSEPAWRASSALKRGRDYAWQLEVVTGKGRVVRPNPPARFRVLDAGAAAEIADARRLYPDDHLLQAILLAHHGLRGDAERELLEYRKKDRAGLADALLRSLRDWPPTG